MGRWIMTKTVCRSGGKVVRRINNTVRSCQCYQSLAMLYCGVILFSALSLVLGHLPTVFIEPREDDQVLSAETFNTPSPQPTPPSDQDEDETDDDEVMGVCFFGSLPTASCMVNCFWRNMSAYCDEDANCRCGTVNEEDDDLETSYRSPIQEEYDDEEGVMGVCYFGHIPSPSCMFRCSVRGQSAVCDEDSRCLCEDRTWRELFTSTNSTGSFPESVQELAKNEPESDDDGSVFLFIFDLGGLPEPEDDTSDNCSPHELWTVPHFVAIAILTLVAVLLVLELTLCCKRRYCHPCKQQLQTVISSEIPEKGTMN